MEHLQHFDLRQDPFQNEPDLRFYFESASHAEPQRRVERGLRQYKGLTVLVAESGTGKTLLSRRILDSLEEELFDAQLMVMLPGTTDARTVLARYARMLGVEEEIADRSELFAKLYEQLAIVREDGRHSVLILDDAHLLDKDAIAEIGSLLNFEYEDRRLLSVLLVGLPQLDVTLSMEPSLGQRVDVRTRLEPLDFSNTAAYLLHRIQAVGGMASLLPEDALGALFKYGRGRPRLLNTLADNALFEAYLAGRKQICGGDVERAASDLGIGTDPGSTYSGGGMPPYADASLLPGAGDSAAASPISDFGIGHDDPMCEPTVVLGMEESSSGTAELDEAMEAVLGESNGMSGTARAVIADVDASMGELPSFHGTNAEEACSAEATRIALPAEEAVVAGVPDDLDDLFAELIED